MTTLNLPEVQARLDFALDAARTCERIILSYYQTGVDVERKGDSTPVTIADRRSEEAIRAGLAEHFPADGILGEEFPEKPAENNYRWILDPLDGTKCFIYGTPLFGTLIGLEYLGQVVLGVCHFPVLNETAWAISGQGAWYRRGSGQPQRAQVSSVSRLEDALFCFTTITGFARRGRHDVFETLLNRTSLQRGWGDCYGHVLVATGRAEIMIDPAMKPWDAAALYPIVTEAGGSFTSWAGEPTVHAGDGFSVNAALKDQVLALTRRA